MRLRKGLVLRHIGKDNIIIDPDKGAVDMTRVYTLNEVAAWLWKQMEAKEFTAEELQELLMQNYEVEHERAGKDVEALINQLKEQGLIEK